MVKRKPSHNWKARTLPNGEAAIEYAYICYAGIKHKIRGKGRRQGIPAIQHHSGVMTNAIRPAAVDFYELSRVYDISHHNFLPEFAMDIFGSIQSKNCVKYGHR